MSSPETFGTIIKGDIPVLVDFFAEWCGPCKMMPPILEQVRDKLGGKVRIIKIDVDKNQKLASSFNVSSVNACYILKGGDKMEAAWCSTSQRAGGAVTEAYKLIICSIFSYPKYTFYEKVLSSFTRGFAFFVFCTNN